MIHSACQLGRMTSDMSWSIDMGLSIVWFSFETSQAVALMGVSILVAPHSGAHRDTPS